MIAFRKPHAATTTAADVEPAQTGAVALLARDLPGLRLVACVAEGAQVDVGTPLLRDRDRAEIRVVSPTPGRVARIDTGYGRRIERIVIETRGAPPWTAPAMPGEDLRETLLAQGLWPEFRTRPFGRVPEPGAQPDAVLVDALGGECAAGVRAAREQPKALDRGLSALRELTRGEVVLCQEGGAALTAPAEGLHVKVGPGGMGAQLRRWHSVARGGEVWTVDCQAVIAIGRLLEAHVLDLSRLIEIAPDGDAGRLLRSVTGADLDEILGGKGEGARAHALVGGSPYESRRWLGRFETRVAWPAPGAALAEASAFGPIVPTPALCAALPAGIRAIPLLRALSIGDADAARRLGCLDLIEEDMRAATMICASGSDYSALLRRVLDELEAER
jgi:Na+-transporting NADH:ubiquinone oxidoreductase subunit A